MKLCHALAHDDTRHINKLLLPVNVPVPHLEVFFVCLFVLFGVWGGGGCLNIFMRVEVLDTL